MSQAALPIIRPITDLRTNLNDVCDQARESREPIIFTKNGSPSLVVMDSDAYEDEQQRNRIYLALREAEIEQKFNPGYIDGDTVRQEMEELLVKLGARDA